MDSRDPALNVWIGRLIWVFTGCKSNLVGKLLNSVCYLQKFPFTWVKFNTQRWKPINAIQYKDFKRVWDPLTLVMLNKLRCHAHFQFSANQIIWSSLLIQIQILNGKQCRSRSVGFFRNQLIWIYTVCKDRVYPGSAGLGLRCEECQE